MYEQSEKDQHVCSDSCPYIVYRDELCRGDQKEISKRGEMR